MPTIIQYIFNLFVFFIVENIDIVTCADDNTPYISANKINNINEVIPYLEKVTDTLFKWLVTI